MTARRKTVILDFDGTLGDTRGLIVRTMQQVISALNLPRRTDEECAAMIGLPLRQTFTDLIEMDEETADKCTRQYARHFADDDKQGEVPLFPHVIETVKALGDAGCLLTIASSRGRDTRERFVENLNLGGYITYVLSANDVEHAKPAPDPVLKTLEDNGADREDAIVVGDTVFDIRMAHAAGVKAVGVTYGNGTREDMERENAEYIIDDFAALKKIVDGL